MPLKLMYVANDPEVIMIAQKYGVDRIWIDLEVEGKEERQKNMNTLKSKHYIDDVKKASSLVNTSELLVRINPWSQKSKEEVEQVIEAGAQIIMLPMWKNVKDVQEFLSVVDGRVKTMSLLETKEAEACIDEVLKLGGIDEIHIGLNDLHLSYGLTFMFEPLVNGTVERLCNKIRNAGIMYGFGGITKIGEGLLPAEKVIMEHYRLGSSMAILSRGFCIPEEFENSKKIEEHFRINMKALREFESYAASASDEAYMENKEEVGHCIKLIVEEKRRRK